MTARQLIESEDIGPAIFNAMSQGVQGIKQGGDKSGHYVVIPADPEIGGDELSAVGPFVSHDAAQTFLDSEVGAFGAKVVFVSGKSKRLREAGEEFDEDFLYQAAQPAAKRIEIKDRSGNLIFSGTFPNLMAALEACREDGWSMHKANLRGAKLHGADLHGIDFSYADLRDADLSNTNCQECSFYRADLYGANTEGIDLLFAHFEFE